MVAAYRSTAFKTVTAKTCMTTSATRLAAGVFCTAMLSLFRLWRSSPSLVSAASTRLQHLRELSARVSVMEKPKVELHVHLDGAILPQTIWDVAKRRGMPLPAKSVEELNSLLKSSIEGDDTLVDFLNKFPIFLPVIAGDATAIEQIAYDFCRVCHENNTIYAETRLAPQLLSSRHDPDPGKRDLITPKQVVALVCKGLERGCTEFGVKVRVILACLHGEPEWAEETLQLCEEFRHKGIVGIDLAGDESLTIREGGFSPRMIAIMQRAKELGISRTIHAGEAGPAVNVAQAVDELHAQRIGHGYHMLDDPALYDRMRGLPSVHFELCPYSSYATTSVDVPFDSHPIIRLARDNMNFSINTDDPTLCLSGLKEEYKFVLENMKLSDKHLAQANLNAAKSCFLPEEEKLELIEIIKQAYAEELKVENE